MSFPFWALSECICNKMELHYIFFSDNVPKFSVQLFQSTLIKFSVMEFSRVLDCTPWSCFILKNDSTRDNSLKFLEVKLSPLKNLWWIPILVATCNICKNRLVYRRCLSGYFEKYAQSTGLWSSISVKKTLSLDLPWVRVWKTEFDWGVFAKAFYSFGNFEKIFWVYFYNKFAGFFSKWWGSISRNVA